MRINKTKTEKWGATRNNDVIRARIPQAKGRLQLANEWNRGIAQREQRSQRNY